MIAALPRTPWVVRRQLLSGFLRGDPASCGFARLRQRMPVARARAVLRTVIDLVPRTYHRVDLKSYTRPTWAFALLYFTGRCVSRGPTALLAPSAPLDPPLFPVLNERSDYFNRSMRYFAKRCDASLSDRGLCKVARAGGSKLWSGKSVPAATEEDIFRALELDYREPWQREVAIDG